MDARGRAGRVVFLERARTAAKPDKAQRHARESAYRIEKALALLWARPEKRYAIHTEPGPDGDAIITVAIRGVAAFEMSIPRAKQDMWRLIQSTIKHGVTVGE